MIDDAVPDLRGKARGVGETRAEALGAAEDEAWREAEDYCPVWNVEQLTIYDRSCRVDGVGAYECVVRYRAWCVDDDWDEEPGASD